MLAAEIFFNMLKNENDSKKMKPNVFSGKLSLGYHIAIVDQFFIETLNLIISY